MAIKIRRGTDTERLTVVLEEGEIAYTTDTKKFYIGDGTTTGGNEIPAGFTPPDGLLQTALELSNTLQSIQDQNSNTSALQIGTDNIGLTADTTATTQTTAVIQATDTNSGIAIVPNGTGAITAQVPDGTSVGGNARGYNSVDLSLNRSVNSYVASGNYTFQGNGLNLRADGSYSVVVGGRQSVSTSTYGVVSGGQNNTASTGTHATVVGGYQNSSTGQYSISGGYSNVASGLGSVALGYDNTASGVYSVAIGRGSTASGAYSFAVGGLNTVSHANGSYAIGVNNNVTGEQSVALNERNTVNGRSSFAGGAYSNASGDQSFSFGGFCISSARNSTSFGYYSKSYLIGQFTTTGTGFSQTGDAQQSTVVSRKQDTLTSGTSTTLSLDGTGTTNLIIPNGTNRVWNVTIKYTAVVTSITGTATGVSVGDCKNEVLTIGFKKIGGTSSVVGSLNTISTNEDISMSTASFGVTAGASQEMKLDFTAPTFLGGGSVTTRVVAKVELTECAY